VSSVLIVGNRAAFNLDPPSDPGEVTAAA
jgi:hypothetical protein